MIMAGVRRRGLSQWRVSAAVTAAAVLEIVPCWQRRGVLIRSRASSFHCGSAALPGGSAARLARPTPTCVTASVVRWPPSAYR